MKYFTYSFRTTLFADLENFKHYKRLNVKSRITMVRLINEIIHNGLHSKSILIKELQDLSQEQLTKILKINPELLEFMI